MRPLRLTISAFGPYLQKVAVDFEQFGEKGLYLISGNTGAGKSMLFEAICYALFGETVCGSDRSAKDLRNQNASDDEVTFVELEFQSGGRRFCIYRSPEYEEKRMARKNHAVHKYEVMLTDRDSGQMIASDKGVKDRIEQLLGITADGFKSIAMIAQGEFMSVIREDTKKRKKILQSVFHTEQYDKLNKKINEFYAKAKENRDALERDLVTALRQIQCGESHLLSSELAQKKQSGYMSPEEVERLMEMVTSLIEEDKAANERLLEEKQKMEEALAEYTKMITEARQRLSLEEQLETVRKKIPGQEAALEKLRQELQNLCGHEAQAQETDRQVGELSSHLPEYARLEEYSTLLSKTEIELRKTKEGLEAVSRSLTEGEETLKKQQAELESSDGAEAEWEKAKAALNAVLAEGESIKKILKTGEGYWKKQGTFLSLQGERDQKRHQKEEAEESARKLRDRYVALEIARLAQELSPGSPCPLCGSTEHPLPAMLPENAPTARQVEEAEGKAKKADEVFRKINEEVVRAETDAQASLRQFMDDARLFLTEEGLSPKEVQERLEALRSKKLQDWSALNAQQKQWEQKVKKMKQLQQAIKQSEITLQALRSQETNLTSQIGTLTERKARLETSLKQLREKLRFASKAEAEQEIGRLKKRVEDLRKTLREATDRKNKCENELSALHTSVRTLSDEMEKIKAYDLAVLNQTKAKAEARKKQVEEAIKQNYSRLTVNGQSRKTFSEKEAAYRKACEYFRRCEDLYKTISGSVGSSDRVSLETYVLAAYLDRILERANERLAIMSDNRYSLSRAVASSDKRKSFGLDLVIHDRDSGDGGKTRKINTFSGGESFMAALAMSLGLSDEIQSSSGGIRMDTMFIDEGFGSLDNERLRLAVDTLTKLSTGQCLIGIISHVEALGELIDHKIIVSKDTSGSTRVDIEY